MPHLPIITEHALSFVIACLATAFVLPLYINWLQRNQIRQYLREEGPASHAAKAKTPTTGGVCFIGGIVFASALCLSPAYREISSCPQTILVVLLSLACGGLGLLDDLAKVRGQANKGLSARLRLVIEALLGTLFGGAMVMLACRSALGLIIPTQIVSAFHLHGGSGKTFEIFPTSAHNLVEALLPPVMIIMISMFVVTATTNAVNLHDGMDGLAAGTAMMVLGTLALMLLCIGHPALSCLSLAGAGSLLGFLFFNRHPAQIFMGDTGSLFLGGLIAGLVLASGLLLWFIPLSAIYIAETLSVMLQVVYFKLTKPYDPPKPINAAALVWLKLTSRLPGQGRRLFRMAPLHHHFEAVLLDRGCSPDQAEWKVVSAFWCTQFILCAITMATFLTF